MRTRFLIATGAEYILIGLLLGPFIGAMLMAAWAVYRSVFEEELASEDGGDAEAAVKERIAEEKAGD